MKGSRRATRTAGPSWTSARSAAGRGGRSTACVEHLAERELDDPFVLLDDFYPHRRDDQGDDGEEESQLDTSGFGPPFVPFSVPLGLVGGNFGSRVRA